MGKSLKVVSIAQTANCQKKYQSLVFKGLDLEHFFTFFRVKELP